MPAFKVRKEKMGDRITALQQLVSPYGMTDTASVLSEAIEYITFLHEQVRALSTPFMKSGAPMTVITHQQVQDYSLGRCCRKHEETRRFLKFIKLKCCRTSGAGPSVQQQIKCFLEELGYHWVVNYVMVQYWIPRRMSGLTVLTVSEQPFAMGGLYNGLCRYRYHCIQQQIDVSSNDVGPIGRVFNGGSPEICLNIDSYSIQEFPMRNYAKNCGIRQYAAFPVSELGDDKQQCIGVLELAVMENDALHDILWSLEMMESLEDSTELRYTTSHARKCYPVRSYLHKSNLYRDMMESVRSIHGMPLIQIWAPCPCDTATMCTELFCHLAISDLYEVYAYFTSFYGTHSLNNGKGLVGKAYSQTKCCFFRDTSRFSMSDNLLVQNTRSFNLTACFAIPLQSIHPKFHPLILEVFLPPQHYRDHKNLEPLLKSILLTVYEQLLRSGVDFGITEDEEFHVEFSNTDDEHFDYFSVTRTCRARKTGAVTGIIQEDEVAADSLEGDEAHDLQMIEGIQESHSLDQLVEANDHSKIIQEDTARTSREAFMNAEAEIILDAIPSGEEVDAAAETLDGELVNSHEMLGNNRKEQQLGTSETKNHLNGQDMAENLRQTCTIDQDEITLDIINQYRGRAKLDDVAKELKVSRATFKRRCRKFGIKRWPYYNKNEVHNIQPSAGLPKTILVEAGGRVIQESEIRQCSNYNETAAASSFLPGAKGRSTIVAGNQDIGQGFSLIVKATCRGDTAKFPFYSNSGIEELRGELVKRFELEVGRLKIKYKDEDDDGEWIILSCSEDLLFHMETLKASGQSTMRLSVFPLTL